MKLTHRLLTTALLATAAIGCWAQSNTTVTYRDALGRKTGTATTDSRGNVTYRDALGRKTGTSSQSGGTTIYRNDMGTKQGTSSR